MADHRDRNVPSADGIQSTRNQTSAPVKRCPDKESDLSHDLDEEERARKIAEQDLNQKKKQTYSGFLLLWLSFQSAGTIYGDIGTSPLYVYSSTFTTQPNWDDLVGALSIIIWSLTLIVTIKYTFIVLRADDDGQGGTFALYSLLARYARITRRDPNMPGTVPLARHDTREIGSAGRGVRSFIERSAAAKLMLQFIGVLGVSLVMADGVLTPAQSVLGAIQGITVANPNLTTSSIVGISCAILVFLFAIQPFGISKLGTAFGPIVVVWLLFNLCAGIYNLAMHDHTVLKAFSPYFAGAYLVRNGYAGWRSLGGLLLAFTGVEAMFADLGAFSRRAIQISWLCLAYPCLLLAYIGQAAFISADPTGTAYKNPFFNTVPPGSFYFSLVISVLAAIVASQAMITSSFQLLAQVMRLSYFPHIKTVHTSTKFHEQVYMPLANWLLMIGTVIVTAVYNNTTSLGNAYGICVILVTFITTLMISLVALLIWRLPPLLILPIFLAFACLDGVFLSAALTKVPEGAWFTLLLAFILSTVFIIWRFGKEQQWTAEGADRDLMAGLVSGEGQVVVAGQGVSTAAGLGIFFDKVGGGGSWGGVPKVFAQFVGKFRVRPGVVVFFHMRALSRPSVPLGERYVIARTGMAGCYRVTVRCGYMDDVLTPELGREVVQQLVLYITRERGGEGGPRKAGEYSPAVQAELNALNMACEDQTVYIIGKEVMKVRRERSLKGFLRLMVLEAFLWIRENSRTKLADLDIDADNLVEVGFVKQI